MVNTQDEIIDRNNKYFLFREEKKKDNERFGCHQLVFSRVDVYSDRLRPNIKVYMTPESKIITDG